jgi:hypothetical protein
MRLSGTIPHHIKMSDLVLRLAGDATVRGATTTEGIQVFSAYDCMALVCQKNESYARMTWSRLISDKSKYKDELEALVYSATFCTGVQNNRYDTPAMTLRGLQRLVQILGDKVAADFRVLVVGTFTRFQAGDTSMIEEIHSNAASSAPIHQAYRQALAQEPVVDEAGTKRQLEREDALFELEIQERNLAIHERKLALEERKSRMGVELQEKNLQVVQTFSGLLTALNPDWKKDARLCLQIEDSMKTAMLSPHQPQRSIP